MQYFINKSVILFTVAILPVTGQDFKTLNDQQSDIVTIVIMKVKH